MEEKGVHKGVENKEEEDEVQSPLKNIQKRALKATSKKVLFASVVGGKRRAGSGRGKSSKRTGEWRQGDCFGRCGSLQ